MFCYFFNFFCCILAPPVIENKENIVYAPQGINYQFPLCRVQSYPKAKVTWKRMSWKPIPLPPNRSSVNGNSLNISNVQFTDEGFYICEAKNSLGKSTIESLSFCLFLQLLKNIFFSFSNMYLTISRDCKEL